MPILPKIQQCSYVRPDGRRCGSPAYTYARNGDHDRCFHHDRDRYPDPIESTPQLREIADVLSDPNFFDYIQNLADRLHSGEANANELEMTINLFLGFDIRDRQALAAFLNDSRLRLRTLENDEEEVPA